MVAEFPAAPKASQGNTGETKAGPLVVDFDRRSVSGFWTQMNGVHDMIPITAVNANSVTFKGAEKIGSMDASIEGTVDRIPTKVDAIETWLRHTGSLTTLVRDLRCKPTKPLF